jgi:UDP-N-acetylglucosamine acyltransferase
MSQTLANIHPEAKIAEDVTVEPFATIGKNVDIGKGSWIGPNAVIMEGARIGKNCKVFPGAVISAIPQDLKFAGEDSTVEIGDNTTIREFVTINRGTSARGKTTVGKNSLIMAYAHIAHDCDVRDNVVMVNGSALAGEVIIDDFAIISAACLIHQFVSIGKHVMMAGGSKTGKDVPPYVTAARYPLSYDGVNSIGLRRRGFSNETIQEIQDIYRVVFQGGFNTSQALEHIEKEFAASEVRDEILDFIRNSRRGLIKGYSESI